jgi:hypothetical protein
MNQRWREHRTCYRPPGELIKTSEYEVASIAGDRESKTFIEAHHYSHAYPAARFRFGLYHHGSLAGVAVFSVPCQDSVLTNVFPVPASYSVELGRFVLLDSVPANGETWFLGRVFNELRKEGLVGVVSFSDPSPRFTADGRMVHRGHVGTIYQAFNGTYLGRSAARTLRLLPDGSVLSDRAIQKIRGSERGSKYAAGVLERLGAKPLDGNPVEWLARWLPRLTRTIRHPGNHKYCWPLSAAGRKNLPPSLPYPKLDPLLHAALVMHCDQLCDPKR